MARKASTLIQSIALVGCLFVTMHPGESHMDGMRRAVETAAKSKDPASILKTSAFALQQGA